MEFDNDEQQQDSQELGDFSFEKSHTGKKKVRKGTKKKKSHRKTKEGDSLNQTGNSQNESQKEISRSLYHTKSPISYFSWINFTHININHICNTSEKHEKNKKC